MPRNITLALALLSLAAVPARAQQPGNIDFSRLLSNLGGNIRLVGANGAWMGGNGELLNTTIAHNGKNWNLIAKGTTGADSTAPLLLTVNGDTVRLDSTGTATLAVAGAPRVTVQRKNTTVSFKYGSAGNMNDWSTTLMPTVNLIAVTFGPESELVKQVGQLQEQLGWIQNKLRASPTAAPSDSAGAANGFKLHTKLNEVKELLKTISADLDAR